MRSMRRSMVGMVALVGLAMALVTTRAKADGHDDDDFGLFVANLLRTNAETLFGFHSPLEASAVGPYDGPDATQAIKVAEGLNVSLVSSAVNQAADQIALWPNDDRPEYLFVCDEETSTPAVERVDLSAPPASNATTIVTGLVSCDPVRRTPWGTIIVAEEAGASGGFYEIFDPVNIKTAINVSDRDKGTTSDPAHLVKRKAMGSLSFESFAIRHDGTTIFGDELAPSGGNPGGAIYKFVSTAPYFGVQPITQPQLSPFDSGTLYGLRVAAANSTNWGQGAEVGKGRWTPVDLSGLNVVDANGNIILRNAQALQKFTGYYRPEDMDIDPVAAANGVFRACWANTGRLDFAGASVVENSAVHGEVLCIVEESPSAAVPLPPTGTIPVVTRFIVGSQQAGMFDNVAFQPHTGNLVVLEDGPTSIVRADGSTQPRGNDLWICLPDGADNDTLTDGCVRFASVRDTSAEPTGFIFLGSGESAFVNIQHRAFGAANKQGALLKISGFKVKKRGRDDDDRDDRRGRH
jgi:secreted PhoX family phosphatase